MTPRKRQLATIRHKAGGMDALFAATERSMPAHYAGMAPSAELHVIHSRDVQTEVSPKVLDP